MQIKEIKKTDPLYDVSLVLRTHLISIPFGFSPPSKDTETPDSHFFVALEKEKVIGFAMITPAADKKSIRLRQLCVDSLYQKKGIGKKLVEWSEKNARKLGYDELNAFAHTGSYPFFEKLGYTAIEDWQTQQNGLKTIKIGKKI